MGCLTRRVSDSRGNIDINSNCQGPQGLRVLSTRDILASYVSLNTPSYIRS